MTEKNYTVREAAILLNVSRFTVIKWVKTGKMRGYRVGPKMIRIPASELDRMVEPLPFYEPIAE